MVSINDIAKEAGVSRGTVDRVLNHRGRVSEETAQKVTEIAERLGYKKSRAGAGLAVRKKKIQIGFVYLNDLKMAPFYTQLLKWAKEEAVHLQQYGVTVHFCPFTFCDQESGIVAEIKDIVADHPEVNGWAMPGPLVDVVRRVVDAEALEDIPFVAYNVAPDDMDHLIGYVGSDYVASGRIACGLAAMMNHGGGHVLLTSLDGGNISSSRERDAGFTQTASNYPDMQIMGRVYTSGGLSAAEELYDRMTKTIASHPEIDTVYIMNPGDYEVVDVIHDAADGRRINVITNDLLSERQKQMLKDGRIAVTIGQEPEKQGARPIEILFEYLAFNRLPIHHWEKTRLDIIVREMDIDNMYLVM